jgi:hypothetical protein
MDFLGPALVQLARAIFYLDISTKIALKIKFYSCRKEGHVKIDCHFFNNLSVKTQWVPKEVNLQPTERTELPNSLENSSRLIIPPMVEIADPFLYLTLG